MRTLQVEEKTKQVTYQQLLSPAHGHTCICRRQNYKRIDRQVNSYLLNDIFFQLQVIIERVFT